MINLDFNGNWQYSYNDSGIWQDVTLPHDAMLSSPRTPDHPSGKTNGYFLGGVYTYKKRWFVPGEYANKTVRLEFGGVYRNASIYLNGEPICFQPYGYTTFSVCLDRHLLYGQENEITVVADNSKIPNSRWYSGGGLYRPVRLLIGGKNHIAWQGVRITTTSIAPAAIRVETSVVGRGDVRVQIFEGKQELARAEGVDVLLPLEHAQLWRAENPKLYTCRVTMTDENGVCDIAEESFGIRQISWSIEGLLINGENTLLKGACIHHDNGILGACEYKDAEIRKLRKLKEFGFNAVRMAHHPASRELLEACDEVGMYMMDEAFDMWYEHKTPYDYAADFDAWHEKDLRAMVAKDYNHPSVIMYSIGNEVSEPREEKGMICARKLQDLLHQTDNTRPVTAGINLMILYMSSKGQGVAKDTESEPKKNAEKKEEQLSPVSSQFFNLMMQKMGAGLNWLTRLKPIGEVSSPILDALDIAGYNYASGRYAIDGRKHPNRIIVGSETFPYSIGQNWKLVEKFPYLIGDFMWTGWDYLGEAAIGAWNYQGVNMENVPYPWLLADVGAFDISGYPGAQAYYAKTVWQHTAKPYIGVRPCNHPNEPLSVAIWRGTNAFDSWAWKNCDGNDVTVEVYADAHDVSLLLNGKRIARKQLKNKKALFRLKYTPGTLTAITCDRQGNEVGRSDLYSAAKEVSLQICPEMITAETGKLLYVDILLAGQDGIVESNADQNIEIRVENGKLLGFGSACPYTEDSYLSTKTRTYYGRAQAVILPESPGEMMITVISENAEPVQKIIQVQEAAQ